ncbi:OLC1v1037184C1, partial [Oldenlandia corymbosa var. corymbosa]
MILAIWWQKKKKRKRQLQKRKRPLPEETRREKNNDDGSVPKTEANKEKAAKKKQPKKENLNFLSRVSPAGVYKIFAALDVDQRKLARKTGFGHILSLGISKFTPGFVPLPVKQFQVRQQDVADSRQKKRIDDHGRRCGSCPKKVVKAYDSRDKSEDQEEYMNLVRQMRETFGMKDLNAGSPTTTKIRAYHVTGDPDCLDPKRLPEDQRNRVYGEEFK